MENILVATNAISLCGGFLTTALTAEQEWTVNRMADILVLICGVVMFIDIIANIILDEVVFGMRLDDIVRIVLNAPTVIEASDSNALNALDKEEE